MEMECATLDTCLHEVFRFETPLKPGAQAPAAPQEVDECAVLGHNVEGIPSLFQGPLVQPSIFNLIP